MRPSAHACVSIPNSYGGPATNNVGYKAPNTSSLRSKKYISELEEDLADLDDTIEREKKKNRANGALILIGSHDDTRNSKASDISFQSSLYEMGSKGNMQNGMGSRGNMQNGITSSNGVTSFVPITDEVSGVINPDYYVERTGYNQGTTGFISKSDERFPEVHFVEVTDTMDVGHMPNLEPIAEESQLHHSDIITDPDQSQDIMIVPLIGGDSQDPRLSGISSTSGSSGGSRGLATIPEEDREAADGDSITASVSASERSCPPSVTASVSASERSCPQSISGPPPVNKPYSRTSLEGTRLARSTLKKMAKGKVPYPLFKDDETGNLENYLEDRRGSC